MKVDEVIAQAVEAGWSDDSRWTPRHIAASLSREQDGLMAAVSVYTDGLIRWTAGPGPTSTKRARVRTGTARSLASGMAAALGALDADTATLF